jgi:hypothetical protein
MHLELMSWAKASAERPVASVDKSASETGTALEVMIRVVIKRLSR